MASGRNRIDEKLLNEVIAKYRPKLLEVRPDGVKVYEAREAGNMGYSYKGVRGLHYD